MNFAAVLAQLNDLPSTFKPDGPPYTQIMDSVASALSLFTAGSDATFNQVTSFGAALGGWLDTWGLLFNVPRDDNEADLLYETRIQRIVSAWVGTLPAIQVWLDLYATGGLVVENTGGVGYTLSFPRSITLAQIQAFLATFNRIRPAGVPFNVQQAGMGVYLGTIDYLGDGRVSGNYLSVLSTSLGVVMSASTPNAVPLLPTVLITDPLITATQ